MARVTGLFDFKMTVEGKNADALVEIIEPGIETWEVVQLVRGEWANVCAPGVSQNRIECRGWERSERSCGSRVPTPGQYAPVVIWRECPEQ
jgi:hypothetical protein